MLKRNKVALIAALGLLSPPVTSAQSADDAANAFGLARAEVLYLQLDGTLGAPMDLEIRVDGIPHVLELEPVSVRAPGFRVLEQREGSDALVEVPQSVARTYRGKLQGFPGVKVRGSWLDDGLHVRIHTQDGDLWIEPLQGVIPTADPRAHVLYRNEDLPPNSRRCALAAAQAPQRGSVPQGGSPSATPQGGTLKVAELAIDADFEYYQDHGSSTNNVENQVESVINSMNAQYEGDVGLTHVITTIIVRTTSNDPYSSSSPSTLLNQFRNHWQSQQQGVQRDVAELFTGKNMSGGVIGIAWLAGICNSFGYNVVESDCCGSFASKTDLSAHELGHNWSAGHCSCSGWTMNSFLTSANQFHPSQTIPEIVNYSGGLPCLEQGGGPVECEANTYGTGLGGANIGVLTSPDDPQLGANFTFSFSGFSSGASGKLLISASDQNISFGGGTILIGYQNPAAQFNVTAASGSGSVSATIPNSANLVGMNFYCQIGMVDLGQPAGWAFSNGLQLQICN